MNHFRIKNRFFLFVIIFFSSNVLLSSDLTTTSTDYIPDLTVRDPTTLKIKEITPVDLKSCHYIPF